MTYLICLIKLYYKLNSSRCNFQRTCDIKEIARYLDIYLQSYQLAIDRTIN